MKLSEVAKITGGKLVGKDVDVSNFCSNSKECSKGSLFFALKGAKRDGHEFIEEVYEKNGYAVSEHEIPFSPYVKVQSTIRALTTLAFEKIKDSLRIAVTGSCGKTTTKEIISHLLEKHGAVCKSVGNFNTDVGISLSILNDPQKNPSYAIFEIGARFPGDVEQLSTIFKPHISIITFVGSSHSMYIDPLKEKSSIVKQTEKFVLYDGNDNLKKVLMEKGRVLRKHVDSFKYKELKTIVKVSGEDYALNGIWGEGQIKDLEFALTLMDELGMSWDLNDLRNFSFLKGRMNIKYLNKNIIIDDTYNASLESLINAAQVAFKLKGKNVIWVLAPMEEIEVDGLSKRLLHIKDEFSPKAIFTVGRLFYPFGESYSLERLNNVVKDGDIILVKGSRIYTLGKIVEEIEGAL
ncbi:Mur ligase family protein [Mesoaciditoga lauensis]|uniref:Mur ligase family protein n=1 Tax=Mesoaciditoga lauensis TaxID=1495039 RepID=UPI00055CF892|nr:UDP-N-acetylmuramoyl-tripeptide--D-alanyl-D-alanine ligase [Mesoaciditoga lauensis]